MRRYARLEAEFNAAGGYAAESEAASIAGSLGLAERVLEQPLRRSPAASAVGSSSRGSSSPAPRPCSSTSRPTTSTPTRSPGCATTSRPTGAASSSSRHDVDLLERGRQQGLPPRRQPRRARRLQPRLEDATSSSARPTSGAGTASAPTPRRRPPRSWPRPTRCGPRRRRRSPPRTWPDAPSGCSPASEGERVHDKVARLRFPDPAPCGQDAAARQPGCPGPTAPSRSSPTSTSPSTAAPGSSSSGLNGAGKTTLLRILAGVDAPDTGEVEPGHGLKLGYYAQEHENLDADAHRPREHEVGRAGPRRDRRPQGARLASSSPATTSTSRPACSPAGRRPGCRWPCSSSPRRTSCCSTSRRTTSTPRPGTRSSARCATYAGAVVLVTHDEGAVEALQPERILLLPDGVEDLWGADYRDLVALA